MRKKLILLGSIILLISSYIFINQLQKQNFTVFNTVAEKQVQKLQRNLKEEDRLDFTALLCNEIRVPFDDASHTFYVPLDMEDDKWERLEFLSGQPEYRILFPEDITVCDKQEAIAEGRKFPMLVFDDTSWAMYNVVFSGLPIIDLATNEGFYAEELTGTAVFYDTDFTIHGTEQSDYNAHIRGNTSRMFPKKGYKLNLTTETKDGSTALNKLSLFGMRKDDDWMLHALYNDDTKLRDRFSIAVWDTFGAKAVSKDSYYGPRMTYVEVFADNGYCGLYGLMERVDAKQLNLAEEDYSYKRKNPGGLVYQYSTFFEEKNPYAEVEGFVIKDGKMTENAWSPLADLCALLTFSDESFLEQQTGMINEESALRLWLFLQIITGHDHTAKNVYYVAKYNEDAQFGYEFYFAPWDLDLTWGNVSVGEVNPVYTAFEPETVNDRVYWETGDRLLELDYHGAREKVQILYRQLRNTVLTDDAVEEMIMGLDDQLRGSGAFARDQERWPAGVHAENCSQLLAYAKERLAFLDKALYNLNYFVD